MISSLQATSLETRLLSNRPESSPRSTRNGASNLDLDLPQGLMVRADKVIK